jgi:hypothetical protein
MSLLPVVGGLCWHFPPTPSYVSPMGDPLDARLSKTDFLFVTLYMEQVNYICLSWILLVGSGSRLPVRVGDVYMT